MKKVFHNPIKKYIEIYQGLPKAVYVIALASFINCIGNFVFPFLTLYLTKYLSYTAVETGRFLMLASIISVPGGLIAGKLADYFGRKKILIISQIGVTLSFMICGCLGVSHLVPYIILCFIFFDGFADPVRGAIQADITNPSNRQASYSFVYMSFNIGYAIGPVLAGLLFYRSPRALFFINGIVNLIAGIMLIVYIPESKPTEEQMESIGNTTEKREEGGLIKALLTRPNIMVFYFVFLLISFSYSHIHFGMPLLMDSLFQEKGAELYGVLMSINGIVVVLANAPVIRLLRKNHPLINVFIATLFFGIGVGSYAFTKNFGLMCVLTMCWTLGEVIEATNSKYYVVNNTPISHRARFSSLVPLVNNLGHALGPYVGGFIINSHGITALWIFSSSIFFLAGAIVLFIYFYFVKGKRSKKF